MIDRRRIPPFIARRIRAFRPNPAVAIAIESFSGRSFLGTWSRFKFAIFNRWLRCPPHRRRMGRVQRPPEGTSPGLIGAQQRHAAKRWGGQRQP